jgi:uncharacterized membrane-anchored protein
MNVKGCFTERETEMLESFLVYKENEMKWIKREAPLFIYKREVRIALSKIDQGLRDKSWRERMWTAASARERWAVLKKSSIFISN